MSRTFCIFLVICSIALLTLNSSIPTPVDNNPIWSGNGATHDIRTGERHGNHTLRARLAAFGANIEDRRPVNLSLTFDLNLGCDLDSLRQGHVSSETKKKHQSPTEESDEWILLMRGECSFINKVRNAQAAGYEGVIIGDDGSSYDSLVTMFARFADDVVIPSLFVTHQSYVVLREAAAGEPFLQITTDTSEMRTDWPLLDTLVFICFSPLCTLFIVYVVLYFRRRRLHLNNILPPAYLSKLETVDYMAKDGVNAECVICLENFQDEEKLLELPCKHLYHGDCIRKWLIERKKLCPICKRDVSVGIDVREGRISESSLESHEAVANVEQAVSEETPLLSVQNAPLNGAGSEAASSSQEADVSKAERTASSTP
ncbi:Uncharacterized RING finger protein C57A7.09 [Taphrina deformans PYCC 5710]|uniref:Uncharacterized RING finger protein C57A7.09 n=1 Tax=Taphrina deformans (strain PYCC 5710 / ATCC 11124 / CBS 356.35 / IMI 108563 / JCM 9778 / NBRC 8474) TaxID=1097556 RepID=R4XAL6_TAPDE|nr:Uncharacterized RING finger protein C57A7.09 [Taphrina deformans PYCC 5710]|eukprot:CCG81348.1 Uncharacterized RING finger protein C57A7.09 [Taphrina deformans PYCC 5710]